MWTRLLYLNLPQAMKPQRIGHGWRRAELGGRYRALLRKTFRLNGVPWIYEPVRNPEMNPYNRKPKGKKFLHSRPTRLAKIKKALADSAMTEQKLRQEKMNNRKLSGLDLLIKQVAPDLLTSHKKEGFVTAEEQRKRKEEAELKDLLDITEKTNKYAELKKKKSKPLKMSN
eukprot:TRINITY_DN1822_c0_g1_i3.p2 TRINITY_DN1822_c0_g1~~TRINITY_DN1822_c0_g1_i3.p2  ORF type:complete len:171 (-),score=51.35 TRINITY_DN1822_c0_g1_i3:462-974(-)